MKIWLSACLVLAGWHGFAQDKSPAEFGRVTAADFAVSLSGSDTAADAVVISDVGINTFEQRGGSAFRWEGKLQRTKRILIRKRRGFEAATVTIPLEVFRSQSEEINGLKAATYNLEGGQVVKTELDKSGIFKINVSENWMAERFTFPNVKEGSIIEFTYTLVTPFVFNNHSWMLQSNYPCLWSEYRASFPSVFSYSVTKRSTFPFCIETTESKHAYIGQMEGELKTFHWAVKDIPAMREEPFTTTVNNYLARVDVRISGFQARDVSYAYNFRTAHTDVYTQEVRAGGVLFSWGQLVRELVKSDRFGADLGDRNSWLDNDLTKVIAGSGDDLSKARRIYAYVRDSFTCNAHSGGLMTSTLKSVFKAKSGSVADLNLLLTAMLEHEKLSAFPVVLSTRSNGFINELMPQATQLNYVVCKLQIGEAAYYLDASNRNLRYDQLPLECYNGYDLVVDTAQGVLENGLSADSLTERKKVVVFLANGDKEGLDGSVQCYPGIAEAAEMRKKMNEQDGENNFRRQLQSGSAAGETIADLEIDSLKMPDEPLVISYSCHLSPDSAGGKLYFTPMMVDRITENPFKEARRVYPVEMPYARDANYILTMDIPSGYSVEELPKSEKFSLEDGGYFEYIMSQDGDQIHFRTRLRLVKANYDPREYAVLREYFAVIVKKENEQIVFKRKK